MNRNQAHAVHIQLFRNVLDEIEEAHQERFANRYAAYLSQIQTEEEARSVFHVDCEPEETESYWVIDFWRLISSRTSPADNSEYTASLSLGIRYDNAYFHEHSAGALLTYAREQLEEHRVEQENIDFLSSFLPSAR